MDYLQKIYKNMFSHFFDKTPKLKIAHAHF
jgi:hypothetical protein